MLFRRLLPAAHAVGTFALLAYLTVLPSMAQDSTSTGTPGRTAEQKSTTVRVGENGTQTITQTEENEHKTTADGEVEIQRFRSPSYAGDNSVTWEREVRTKKMADGTVEKEYVVKNPDGGNHLTPVQIIREKIIPGKETTTIEREMLSPDYEGHWHPIQKETAVEKSTGANRQTIKDIQQPDAAGDWRVVERQRSLSRSTPDGTHAESVRQVPDGSGRLADYERREERSASQAGKETHEVTLQRRDFSDTDARQFYLVEHTTTQSTKPGSGTVVNNAVTESDLLPDSPMRNFDSSHAQVTQQRTEEIRSLPDGTKQTSTQVNQRTAGDPTDVHPVYKMIEQKDKNGYVRQVYIPAQ